MYETDILDLQLFSEGGDGGTDDPPAGDSTPSGKYTKELKALLLEADTLE